MKIAIDARKWRDYGIGTYVRNLVRHLAGLDRETTYFVFCDRADEPTLRDLAARGVTDVVVSPLGFVSDHIEVLYDLDHEARAVAGELGLQMVRAGTVGTHPAFVAMIRELVQERLDPSVERRTLGRQGPVPDVCPPGCCLPGTGRPSPWDALQA